MKKLFFTLLFFYCFISYGEIVLTRLDSIKVMDSVNYLNLPWAGGFNNPQFSEIDLNGDGIKDLFVFDRSGNRIFTFINNGTKNTVDYKYDPIYENKFPKLTDWALLNDYNCDGKEDILTSTGGGIAVYRNDYAPTEGLVFTKVKDPVNSLYSDTNFTNLYVNSVDLPSFVDLDYDGDMDILAFATNGRLVEFHKNRSMEKYGLCDSLDFKIEDNCWGKFEENGLSNTVSLGISCKASESMNGNIRAHSGSSVKAIDIDFDLDYDLLLGDISFPNTVQLLNGGDTTYAQITAFDDAFPSFDTSVNVYLFPAAFYFDVDNDSLNDLLIAPNGANLSDNVDCAWWYKNSGNTKTLSVKFQSRKFLVEEMIDVGAGANPQFFDYNADGLMDLIIGNDALYKKENYSSSLTLFENIGSDSVPEFKWITDNYQNIRSLGTRGIYPAFGDMDNDGDEDMMLGDWDGILHLFTNTAGAGSPANFSLNASSYKGIDAGNYSTPQIADVNRDGKSDLLVGERSGNINYFENIGTASTPDFSSIATNVNFGNIDVMIPCCTGYSSPFLYEEKGQYKMMVGSERGTIYFYDNIDSNLSSSFNLVDSFTTNGSRLSITAFDMNKDNSLEILTGIYTGGVSIYQIDNNTGLHFNNPNDWNLNIFPNPSKGLINIQSNIPIDKIQLFNTFGIKIEEQSFLHQSDVYQIKFKNTTQNIYILKIISGNTVVSKKLIVSE